MAVGMMTRVGMMNDDAPQTSSRALIPRALDALSDDR